MKMRHRDPMKISHTYQIAFPRQVAMYLCRKYTETSFPAIGDKFGGRDHSTVIHASKTIEKKIKDLIEKGLALGVNFKSGITPRGLKDFFAWFVRSKQDFDFG